MSVICLCIKCHIQCLTQIIVCVTISLPVMDHEFMQNERSLLEISEKIRILNMRMMLYVTDIQIVARYHRTCGAA